MEPSCLIVIVHRRLQPLAERAVVAKDAWRPSEARAEGEGDSEWVVEEGEGECHWWPGGHLLGGSCSLSHQPPSSGRG